MAIYLNGQSCTPYYNGEELWQLRLNDIVYYQAELRPISWSVTVAEYREKTRANINLTIDLPAPYVNATYRSPIAISGSCLSSEITVNPTATELEKRVCNITIEESNIKYKQVKGSRRDTGTCILYWDSVNKLSVVEGGLTERECNDKQMCNVPGRGYMVVVDRKWIRYSPDTYYTYPEFEVLITSSVFPRHQ